MNDIVYDITHLLDIPSRPIGAPAPRVVRAKPATPATPAPTTVASSALVQAPETETPEPQATLARELMKFAAVHDALVQQYLRMSGTTFRAAYGE